MANCYCHSYKPTLLFVQCIITAVVLNSLTCCWNIHLWVSACTFIHGMYVSYGGNIYIVNDKNIREESGGTSDAHT